MIFSGYYAVVLSVGSTLKMRLKESIIRSTTNSRCFEIEYLLSMSGLPKSHAFTRRVSDTSFFMRRLREPSTRTS